MLNFRISFVMLCIFGCIQGSLFAQKTIEVDSTVLLVDGTFAPFNSVGPGDTLLLKAGRKSLLILRNLNGTSQAPITIKNGNGLVEISSNHYFGISIRKCNHIILSGNGDPNLKYGIKIDGVQGSGLSIGDYTSNFEVENIEVRNVRYSGIIAKTEPDCDFDRNSFIQENSVIHDCWIYNSGNEGMYIGSSFYSGQTLQCNGAPKTVFPPLLKNVEVYNNLVEYAGWDGIQVSSAINTKIHHNKVIHDSQAQVDWQMTGIILGGGSTGSIYNNFIKDGEGTGIFTNGLGDINIYNNIILNPGFSNDKSSGSYGMYITDEFSFPSMYFNIFNNLITNPKHRGIRFSNELSTNKNLIANNIIVKSDMSGSPQSENQFIETVGNPVIKKTNYTTNNIQQLFFKNVDADDYSLLERSPLIDAGSKIINNNNKFDFNNNPRELGAGIDIGPIESTYYKVMNALSNEPVSDLAFPNPVEKADYFTLMFNNELNGNIYINLVDNQGRKLKELTRYYSLSGNQMITLDAINLRPGLNYIQIAKTNDNSIVRVMMGDEF